jgi:hypothetical protein
MRACQTEGKSLFGVLLDQTDAEGLTGDVDPMRGRHSGGSALSLPLWSNTGFRRFTQHGSRRRSFRTSEVMTRLA